MQFGLNSLNIIQMSSGFKGFINSYIQLLEGGDMQVLIEIYTVQKARWIASRPLGRQATLLTPQKLVRCSGAAHFQGDKE